MNTTNNKKRSTTMRKRSYLSGSDKRKLKLKRESEKKNLRGSLSKFLVNENNYSNDSSSDVSFNLSSPLSINIDPNSNDPNPCQALNENFKESSNVDLNFSNPDPPMSIAGCNINENACRNIFQPSSSEMICDVTTITELGSENFNMDELPSETDCSFDPDPALWEKVTDRMREYFAQYPPKQNMELIKKTKRVIDNQNRHLTQVHFFRNKCNEEKVKREWLVLSPSLGALFCWVCKLFSNSCTALSATGFTDWKHTSSRLKDHENSYSHREAVCALTMRKEASARIDMAIVEQNYSESRYWFEVLRRVVSVVKFLSTRGLPFFGQNETIGSVNNGNFLGCMEMLSEFDPFIAQHLEKHGNPGSGRTSYLSSTIISEFVELMGKKVLDSIIKEVHKAKYFSIILDSTPDLSNTDQLCFVIRYVSSDCEPVERFLTFLPIHSHKSEHIEQTVLEFMEKKNLNIACCRGQGYDNASNMAGRYNGLQARIKNLNPFADFVPCSAHSLNLVIVKGVECNSKVLDYFNFLQEIYKFFSVSTHRWKLLTDKINKESGKGLTLKSRSSTRWCANADATRALICNYTEITQVLHDLSTNIEKSPTTRHEAASLKKKLAKFETAIFFKVWDAILQRANSVSKTLQSPAINLSEVPELFKSLVKFIDIIRGRFEEYEYEASQLVENANYTQKRKVRLPKRIDDGNADNVDFDSREDFRTSCFLVICDTLISELCARMSVYKEISEKFSCLFDVDEETAYKNAKVLQSAYPSDLEVYFPDEFIQFLSIVQKENTLTDKLKKIKKVGISDTFPNVETALKIFLTLPISNCSGERSFSLLKRIKSPLRTLITDSKLSFQAILSIEADITKMLEYDDIISDFIAKKCRRKIILK